MIHRKMYVIRTGPAAIQQEEISALLSDEEYAEVKRERPDLIVELMPAEEGSEANPIHITPDVPAEVVDEVIDYTKGVSVTGMTLPHDIGKKIEKLLEK